MRPEPAAALQPVPGATIEQGTTRVLVPIDGSRLSDAILGHVRRLVHRDRGRTELHLLTVLDAKPPTEPERLAARLEARGHLTSLRQVVAGECGAVHTVVVEGDPVAEILEMIHTRSIDLVAMASHGRAGVGRWVRGSVAERVLRNSPVPVFVATPAGVHLADDTVAYRRLLVPLDGGAASAQVLPMAGTIALGAGAEVVLLHVVRPGEAGVGAPQARAEELLEPARAQLAQVGVRASIEGRVGDAAEVILAACASHDVDLLAISTHGRSGIARWRFGSVAEAVLRKARCPVLAYRMKDA